MVMATILIIGEDPKSLRPEDRPPGVTDALIMNGLNGSCDALRAKGHQAELLLTTSEERISDELAAAVRGKSWDVLVIGAGLRTLPPMTLRFECLMNAIREHAPKSKLAFNANAGDSANAALRQLG